MFFSDKLTSHYILLNDIVLIHNL